MSKVHYGMIGDVTIFSYNCSDTYATCLTIDASRLFHSAQCREAERKRKTTQAVDWEHHRMNWAEPPGGTRLAPGRHQCNS